MDKQNIMEGYEEANNQTICVNCFNDACNCQRKKGDKTVCENPYKFTYQN